MENKEGGTEIKDLIYFESKAKQHRVLTIVREIFRLLAESKTGGGIEKVIALHIKDIRERGENELADELVEELNIDESLAPTFE